MSLGDEDVSNEYIGFKRPWGTSVAALKWGGKLEQLQAAVDRTGRMGDWTEVGGNHVFRAIEGGVLTWYPRTKTVLIQGNDDGFAAAVEAEIRIPRASLDFDD